MTAPRAERPELVARFRSAGLTQKQTAETLGVSRDTVKRHDEPTYAPREAKGADAPFEPGEIVDAEIVEDEEPTPSPKSRPPGLPEMPDVLRAA